MLNEVKELKRKEIEEKRRECDQLISKLDSLEQKIDELTSKKSKNTSLIVSKKFNFLQKHITKRKEYKEYINAGKENDDISRRIVQVSREIDSLSQEIKEKQNIPLFEKINKEELDKNYDEKIHQIDEAKNFSQMDMDVSDAKKLLEENGVDIKYDSCREALQLSYEEFSFDEEFMENAINEDKELIAFDNTNSDIVYINYLNKLKKSLEEAKKLDESNITIYIKNIDDIISEIENPRQAEEGKYKVPHKFLYEAIRTKAGANYENEEYKKQIYKDKFSDIVIGNEISNEIDRYLKIDSNISKKLGNELEQIWTEPGSTFVIHNILRNHNNYGEGEISQAEKDAKAKETIESIFTKGLKATNSMGELEKENPPDLSATSYRQGEGLTFIDAIDYTYAGGMYNIVMKVPSDAFNKDSKTPIWGTNDKDAVGTDRQFYLLPEYVYGCFKAQDADACMIKNDIKDKQVYKYVTYDKHAKNEYKIIENNQDLEEKQI